MKDAYYFPHDSNARHDPKISEIRSKHGAAGYAWYFMLVEMLREQDGYRLLLSKCNAYAMQMQIESDACAAFVRDCIDAELFDSDGVWFWSESLKKRMFVLDEKREKRRKAAQIRWDKYNEDALHVQSDATKVKESKLTKVNHKGGADESATSEPTPKGKPDYKKVQNLNIDAWEKWQDDRKRRRLKPYTTTQEAERLSQLSQEAQLKCVLYSLDRFSGLYPERFNHEEDHGQKNLGRRNYIPTEADDRRKREILGLQDEPPAVVENHGEPVGGGERGEAGG